jgi:hypothetical protein
MSRDCSPRCLHTRTRTHSLALSLSSCVGRYCSFQLQHAWGHTDVEVRPPLFPRDARSYISMSLVRSMQEAATRTSLPLVLVRPQSFHVLDDIGRIVHSRVMRHRHFGVGKTVKCEASSTLGIASLGELSALRPHHRYAHMQKMLLLLLFARARTRTRTAPPSTLPAAHPSALPAALPRALLPHPPRQCDSIACCPPTVARSL